MFCILYATGPSCSLLPLFPDITLIPRWWITTYSHPCRGRYSHFLVLIILSFRFIAYQMPLFFPLRLSKRYFNELIRRIWWRIRWFFFLVEMKTFNDFWWKFANFSHAMNDVCSFAYKYAKIHSHKLPIRNHSAEDCNNSMSFFDSYRLCAFFLKKKNWLTTS